MWKALILLFFVYDLSLADDHKNHLRELKKEFPYGLLTDDYGILNRLDLKINACTARPGPFIDPPVNHAYSYWQCFEVKNSKMICERGKYDPHEEALMSMLVLSGIRDGEVHEFISRRPIALQTCRLYQRDWKKFTNNEKYICVSGVEPSKEIVGAKIRWTWIFGRYKTRKGCDSYFDGECDEKRACGT